MIPAHKQFVQGIRKALPCKSPEDVKKDIDEFFEKEDNFKNGKVKAEMYYNVSGIFHDLKPEYSLEYYKNSLDLFLDFDPNMRSIDNVCDAMSDILCSTPHDESYVVYLSDLLVAMIKIDSYSRVIEFLSRTLLEIALYHNNFQDLYKRFTELMDMIIEEDPKSRGITFLCNRIYTLCAEKPYHANYESFIRRSLEKIISKEPNSERISELIICLTSMNQCSNQDEFFEYLKSIFKRLLQSKFFCKQTVYTVADKLQYLYLKKLNKEESIMYFTAVLMKMVKKQPKGMNTKNIMDNLYKLHIEYKEYQLIKNFVKSLGLSDKGVNLVILQLNNLDHIIAKQCENNKDYLVAVFMYKQSVKEFKNDENREVDLAFTYLKIAKNYNLAGKYDKAIKYFEKAAKILEASMFDEDLLLTYIDMADLYFSCGHYDKADFCINEVMVSPYADFVNSYIAKCFNLSSNIRKIKGEYNKAIDFGKRAIDEHKRQNICFSYELYYLRDIGMIYLDKMELKKAEKYFNRASLIIEFNSYPAFEMITLYNCLGYTAYLNQKFDDSISYYKSSLKAQQKVSYYHVNADFLFFTKAMLAYTTGNFEQAITYFNKSIDLRLVYKEKTYKTAFIYDLLGNSYMSVNDIENAIVAFKKAIKVHRTMFLQSFQLLNIYKNLVIIYQNQGNSKKALKYLIIVFKEAYKTKYQTETGNLFLMADKISELSNNAGEYVISLEYANISLKLNKTGKSAYLNRARSFFCLEKYEMALQNVDYLLSMDSKHEDGLDLKELILQKIKE